MNGTLALEFPDAADAGLARSFDFCREVVRTRAGSFSRGMKLVPEPKRSAIYALYAWMRQADDLADEPGEDAAKRTALQQFWLDTQNAMQGHTPDGLLWPAFQDTATRYNLTGPLLRDLIKGQLLDLDQTQYNTFNELYDYCYKVASVVGLLCIEIWGFDGSDTTRKLAEYRGIAFQLTNILRDIREDADRGRIYIPGEFFAGASPTPQSLLANADSRHVAAVQRVIAKAWEYYEASEPLDQCVDRSGRSCLWAMTEVYKNLLRHISRDPASVLSHPPRVTGARKLVIALEALVNQ